MKSGGQCFDGEKAKKSKSRGVAIAMMSILVVFAIGFVAVEASEGSNGNDSHHHHHAWTMVKSACSNTRYPKRCVSSMASYPAYQTAKLDDLTKVALQVSMRRAKKAHNFALSLQKNLMKKRERVAWRDCLELFEDTIDHLKVCSSNGSLSTDSPVWLSAALTNQETCLNGFRDLNLSATNPIRALMSSRAVNLSELVSNSLSMYKLFTLPTKNGNNRRLLSVNSNEDGDFNSHYGRVSENGFPQWLSAGDRRLLRASSLARHANAVVAQDGSGNYRTIAQAIKAAPLKSRKRYIIYIKAGTYKENIDIAKKITNLMLVGDGKDKTVVTGSKSVQDGVTTFRTATVAVSGNGFIARDMTFENTAGPQKHQAVALRVGSDRSAVYQCSIKGYQDTLYVYSLRQFYREVDIYGTVDFIFGNAAVVIQNSRIIARRPMINQKNTITAQGRTDPNEHTGISIHNCRVSASSSLQRVKGSIKTYLGRPWKEYSRTLFIQSTLDDHIDPAGWLEWDGNFALSTLCYGEYMNRGWGAGTSKRVNWPGFHVITSPREAYKFTVGKFISGRSWIPATGLAFTLGLN
uniref:Pectinesterase n=1 Tax=Cunninghamia lanceolata TaxID=28977 RepID=A0A6G9W213_CUNLA|nr:pectin methylesterase 16 [Cunninghamia lanceolata]